MQKIPFPKNKNKFIKLIKFYNELLPILKKLHIKTLVTGSLAYLVHTKDKKAKVNDLDLLVHEIKFPILLNELEKGGINCNYVPEWKTIVACKREIVIDFDSFEKYYGGKNKIFEEFRIGAINARCVGLEALIKAYKIASLESKTKSKEYKMKLNKLISIKKQN